MIQRMWKKWLSRMAATVSWVWHFFVSPWMQAILLFYFCSQMLELRYVFWGLLDVTVQFYSVLWSRESNIFLVSFVTTSIPVCLLVALLWSFLTNFYRHKFHCSNWTSIFVISPHRNFLSRVGDGRNLEDSVKMALNSINCDMF